MRALATKIAELLRPVIAPRRLGRQDGKEINSMKTYEALSRKATRSGNPFPQHTRCTTVWLVLAVATLILFFANCWTTKTNFLLNNTPQITGASPSMIPEGSPDTTLTIEGLKFKSAIARAFNVPLPDDSVSDTQIVTKLPASMLATPGTIPITVVNFNPAGNLISNVFNVNVTSGTTTGPVWGLSKMHSGNFTQGQTGATYTVTASNAGSGPTDGTVVTVTDMLPSGLTLTGESGTGWGCTAPPTCTRGDVLNGGASYSPITVNVSVATNAPPSVTNDVSVSGGGSAPATASDPTTINGPTAPQLALAASSLPATFAPGGTGSYMVAVSNTGNAATSGTVSLMFTLSSALTPLSLSGAGWSCNTTMLTCTIATPLPAGMSYSPVTLNVVVDTNPPPTVMTTITGSGGGSSTVMTSVSNPT